VLWLDQTDDEDVDKDRVDGVEEEEKLVKLDP
jgi:hypothetical protein